MPSNTVTAVAAVGGAALAVGGTVALLPLVGFAAGGVAAGSAAAAAQAAIGNVAAGSLFASLQSAGVVGLAATTKLAIGTAGAATSGYITRYFK